MACGILVPWLGIEPVPSALGAPLDCQEVTLQFYYVHIVDFIEVAR